MSLQTKRRRLLKNVNRIMRDSSTSDSGDDQSSRDSILISNEGGSDVSTSDSDDDPTSDVFAEDVCSSTDCSESSSADDFELHNRLKSLFLDFPRVPLSFIKRLLLILKDYHHFLPRDPRVMLGTNRGIMNLKTVEPGKYYHVGILTGVRYLLNRVLFEGSELTLQFNIDGLPPFRSNVKSFWPILCSIREIPNSVFVVGVYFGERKPNSSNDFLSDFISELRELLNEGVTDNNKTLRVLIDGFCCDTPARSFVKCVKSHCGYFGCDRCEQRGEHVNNRMTFPNCDAPRRTNITFRAKHQEEHHHATSNIELVQEIDMVQMFPNDYMHSVCKGVGSTLLEFLRSGPLPYRLGARQIEEMSAKLLSLRQYIPCDFARKPRSLRHLSMWKATEARLFCLYLVPIVLKSHVDENFFTMFMTFSLLLRLLSHPVWVNEHQNYCDVLVRTFLNQVTELLGSQYLTYNFHSLVHLVEDCKQRGVVDNFSCYQYESFLFKLKRLVRSPNLPMEQIINRISESGPTLGCVKVGAPGWIQYEREIEFLEDRENFEGASAKYFRKLTLKSLVLKAHSADSYVMMQNNHVLRIMYFVKVESQCFIVGNEYTTREFTDFPLISLTGVCMLSSLLKKSISIPLANVKCKLLCIPTNKNFLVSPILHSYNIFDSL